jgi:hypothetical protein
VRLLLLVPAAAMGFGGCLGSEPGTPPRPPAPVQVELATGPAPAGPPDAGTVAGHGVRAGATVRTRGARVVVRGTVRPTGSDVRLLDGATHGQSAIARRRGARFALTLDGLRPGANRFIVEAAHPGRATWRRALRVVRRAPRVPVPRRVTVPVEDPTPPEAGLRLDRRTFVAVAVGRDHGGMARIRVSAELRVRCRAVDGSVYERGLVRHRPPPQIARQRILPGTRVPGELRRRTDLRRTARALCAETGATLAGFWGVVWADATNAHDRDRYSADVQVCRNAFTRRGCPERAVR